jgi:hypothetical protein
MRRKTRFQCTYRGNNYLSMRELYESFPKPAVSYASFRYRILKKNYDPSAAAYEAPQRAIEGRTDWQPGMLAGGHTLVERSTEKYKGTYLWTMACKHCGSAFIGIPSAAMTGRVKSCGCLAGSRRRKIGGKV